MQNIHTVVFSMMIIVAAFTSCAKEETPAPASTNYTHTYPDPYVDYTLGGTTWVLTMYHDTMMTTNITANDTLIFIDSTHYTWNGVPCTYQCYADSNYTTTFKKLCLGNTPFGSIAANVPGSFIQYGKINDIRFSGYNGCWYMWFEKQ